MIFYLLFFTIHDVLRAEKALKKYGADFELVPVPRNLSSDCGMCIQLKSDIAGAKSSIGGIELDKCVSYDGKEYQTIALG